MIVGGRHHQSPIDLFNQQQCANSSYKKTKTGGKPAIHIVTCNKNFFLILLYTADIREIVSPFNNIIPNSLFLPSLTDTSAAFSSTTFINSSNPLIVPVTRI